MNVASLWLCKELYEISGWKTPMEDNWYAPDGTFSPIDIATAVCPAYDLGYLLRKLDTSGWAIGISNTDTINGISIGTLDNKQHDSKKWWANKGIDFNISALTPEDAAAKLAIELWKQGVLK